MLKNDDRSVATPSKTLGHLSLASSIIYSFITFILTSQTPRVTPPTDTLSLLSATCFSRHLLLLRDFRGHPRPPVLAEVHNGVAPLGLELEHGLVRHAGHPNGALAPEGLVHLLAAPQRPRDRVDALLQGGEGLLAHVRRAVGAGGHLALLGVDGGVEDVAREDLHLPGRRERGVHHAAVLLSDLG